MNHRTLLSSTLISSLAFVTPLASMPAFAGPDSAKKIPDRYIVVLKDGSDAQTVAKNHKLNIDMEYNDALHGFAAVGAPGQLKKIADDDQVAFVEQDVEVQMFAQTLPTGINRIDADFSPTAKINGLDERVNADIAIIDTGIQKIHPDLNVIGGYNCTPGSANKWDDDNGHGTHVSGTAAAKDNGSGVVGVAPGARLYGVKVLDRNGSGQLSWIICGINWVTQNASIIDAANMSLGGQFTSAALDTAIANATAKGVTFAVAAGNSASDSATFSPANNPNVLTVSALADSDGKCGALGAATSYGPDDTLASFSNFGSAVDIAAPGVNIYSTYKGNIYTSLSGTSMASPHVAGAIALYVATHGRDVNGDTLVNALDTAAIRLALTTAAVPQAQSCSGNGNGGFTGDPDAFHEPVLMTQSF